MKLWSEQHPDATLIVVKESRIDAAGAIAFKDGMREMCLNGAERIVLDLKAVDFVDSSGLGAIVAAMKHMAPAQKLELAGLTPTVSKVFRLTRMDSVFEIHPDAASALKKARLAG